MHLLPSGKVFYSGPSATSYLFNPSNQSWATVATTKLGADRTYGSSVLLGLTPANNYDPKVFILGGGNSATSTTELIDLGSSSPSWSWGPDMSQARVEMEAVLLPTGDVLALGGSARDEDSSTASLNADLYDPGSNSFSSAGSNAYPRLYHTVALLLPDATVWLAGSNPSRGTWESHIESYRPAYLFNSDGSQATRPTISSTPSNIAWGGQFSVSTPDAGNISQAVLMRPGTSTHAFDMDQRLVGMSFTAGSGATQQQDCAGGILHAVSDQQQRRAIGGNFCSVGQLGVESCAYSKLDLTDQRLRIRRNSRDHHGHGFPVGRDGKPGRNGGYGRERGKQHLDYRDYRVPFGGIGERGGDQ
jgi:hypothetical protein